MTIEEQDTLDEKVENVARNHVLDPDCYLFIVQKHYYNYLKIKPQIEVIYMWNVQQINPFELVKAESNMSTLVQKPSMPKNKTFYFKSCYYIRAKK